MMSDNATSDAVLRAIDGDVAHLRLNRPARMNAVDVELACALRDQVASVLAMENIAAVVLSGAGRTFAAGGDLASFRASSDSAAMADAIIGPMHQALSALKQSGAIFLCAVHGNIAGAGMSITAMADLAIAADDATFTMAYARVAATPDCGGTWALPRVVGARKALELALLSDTIDAATALQIGLVNRLVPQAELETAVLALARLIAQVPAPARIGTKRLMQASPMTLDTQLQAEQAAFAQCAANPAFDAALERFFQARKPAR